MEPDVQAMARKGSDLLRLSVITYANYWHCSLFDHVDNLGDSSSVTLAHSVHLIHDHQILHQA
jgi:hypothetical protein